MKVKLTTREADAFIQLQNMLKRASTPTPVFLNWVAARLELKGDEPEIDFIQKLREYARDLSLISALLDIRAS